MPKSKELLFLCRNVGTGQRSALLCCLCVSPHLSPSPFFPSFWHLFPLFLLLLHFQYTLSCLNPPPSLSPPCCLLTDTATLFFLPLFFLSLLVYLCFLFLTHLTILHPFPPSALVFDSPSSPSLSPVSQCSCRRTRPTRCCTGCAGPTSCWRRWSRVTSRGSAARRSAPTRRHARLSRTTRRRWGDERCTSDHIRLELQQLIY